MVLVLKLLAMVALIGGVACLFVWLGNGFQPAEFAPVQPKPPGADRLAIQWGRSAGYSVPVRPGFWWLVGTVIGLAAGVVPGLVIAVMWFIKERDYEREVRQLRNKWIDAGRPAPLPPAD